MSEFDELVASPGVLMAGRFGADGGSRSTRPRACASKNPALTGIMAATALILLDLPQPADYAAEGDRVLWTLCGVGIGVLIMFLAGLLAKRTAKAPPQPAVPVPLSSLQWSGHQRGRAVTRPLAWPDEVLQALDVQAVALMPNRTA